MGQVSWCLRRGVGRYVHWCPACHELHPLPDNGWQFDGNLECPTFTPSFKHSGGPDPKWLCHYTLTKGMLHFCGDCSHAMGGQAVPLPELPPWCRDPNWE